MNHSLQTHSHFVKLNENDINNFNKQHKIKLPKDLEFFYKNYGYGVIQSKPSSNFQLYLLSPNDILNLEDGCNDFGEIEDYSEYLEDQILFLSFSEESLLGIGCNKNNHGKIYQDDVLVSDSFNEFLDLYSDNPLYFNKINMVNYDLKINLKGKNALKKYYKYNRNLENKLNKLSEKTLKEYIFDKNIFLPSDLLYFYNKIGFGIFLDKYNNINLILHPYNLLKFKNKGKLYPEQDIYEEYSPYQKDKIIFFKDDKDNYISIGCEKENYNQIFYKNIKIANSLSEFIDQKLLD